MGKVRIAQTLARAGLSLSPSTVKRWLSQSLRPSRGPNTSTAKDNANDVPSDDNAVRAIVANWPHHVWHIDFTIVPTHAGLWVPWFPFSWLQVWPLSYCVAAVVDHDSRKVVAIDAFKQWPKSGVLTRWLDVVIQSVRHSPKYIVSGQGPQFRADYQDWCTARSITPRFGAVGQHGSIAIIERFILSLKNECTRRTLVPLKIERFRQELLLYLRWYNEHRPHQALHGRTPTEAAGETPPAATLRFEPRASLLELSQERCKREPDVVPISALRLNVERLDGRAHLPIVHLERAA